MKKGIVVQGDSLSSGGIVLSIERKIPNIMNIPFACVGDKVKCGIPIHGISEIIEGSVKSTINGMPIALQGHKASCGCTLIATQFGAKLTIEESIKIKEPSDIRFDKKFLLKDYETKEVYRNQKYKIHLKDGCLNGRTDDEGFSENIDSKKVSEILNIEIVK